MSLKGAIGSYECFGNFDGKSSYKMSEKSLYLYYAMYSKKWTGNGYDTEKGWMVKFIDI